MIKRQGHFIVKNTYSTQLDTRLLSDDKLILHHQKLVSCVTLNPAQSVEGKRRRGPPGDDCVMGVLGP